MCSHRIQCNLHTSHKASNSLCGSRSNLQDKNKHLHSKKRQYHILKESLHSLNRLNWNHLHLKNYIRYISYRDRKYRKSLHWLQSTFKSILCKFFDCLNKENSWNLHNQNTDLNHQHQIRFCKFSRCLDFYLHI